MSATTSSCYCIGPPGNCPCIRRQRGELPANLMRYDPAYGRETVVMSLHPGEYHLTVRVGGCWTVVAVPSPVLPFVEASKQ